MQTAELSASRKLLEDERLRYRGLFESAPVAYLVTTAEGMITDANQAASTLLRVPKPHLIGKPLAGFISPRAAAPSGIS